jgi:hypothetical protein
MRGLVSPTGLRYHFPHLIPIWTREEWVWKLCVHHRRKRKRRQTHTLVDWILSTTGPIAVSFIMKLGNLIDWFVFFFALITWWLNFYSYLFIWWTPAFFYSSWWIANLVVTPAAHISCTWYFIRFSPFLSIMALVYAPMFSGFDRFIFISFFSFSKPIQWWMARCWPFVNS